MLLQYYHFIEIAIRQCKSSGIDCKVHGLSIVGRLRSDDDDLAANFMFLASDNEDDEEKPVTQTSAKKSVTSCSKEIQTHVFVWGLNDKDQLGGPKGSKVSCCICLLNQFVHILFLPKSSAMFCSC